MHTQSRTSLPSAPAAAAFAFAAWLLGVVRSAVVAAFKPGPARPRGADELRGMSDHELRDLGIGRSEIPHVLDPGWGRTGFPPARE